MKKILFNLLIPVLFVSSMNAQTGKVLDNLSIPSKILSGERKYAIYLPPDYDRSERSYPVLYLLHGSGDDQTGWVQFGEVLRIADKAIIEGKSTAMIIVMPDANSVRRGYFNSPDGKFRYEDFFFSELIPYIEKNFRVRAEKRYRAISGLSMGGGGTIVFALHHPDLFSSACPLSAGNGLQDLETSKQAFKTSNPELTDQQIDAYARQINGFELVESLPSDQVKSVRWYIDCGDDDPRSENNSRLHAAMNKKGIPHEFRIREGGHTWTYWRESLPEVLSFVSQGFHQF
jgi:enterochelin esterase-like enzyme